MNKHYYYYSLFIKKKFYAIVSIEARFVHNISIFLSVFVCLPLCLCVSVSSSFYVCHPPLSLSLSLSLSFSCFVVFLSSSLYSSCHFLPISPSLTLSVSRDSLVFLLCQLLLIKSHSLSYLSMPF